MNLQSFARDNLARFLAVICLLVGLGDTARLVGLTSGVQNPLVEMGVTAFVFLGIFAISRLFASVGLWMGASWGSALLVGVTALELALMLIGSSNIQLGSLDIIIRLMLFVGILAVLGLKHLHAREQLHD